GSIPGFGSEDYFCYSIFMDEHKKRIVELETLMQSGEFWADKAKAQAMVKELNDLKDEVASGGKGGKYDKGDAIMTIFSGAGGDDAEDFSSILYRMYRKLAEKRGWGMSVIHENTNDHGGYRNITVEISGKGVYGILKNESGVHRLVRISPFNAKQLRHTSFSMVEVIPKFEKVHSADVELPEKDLEISIAKSGGPGGQNVNKRETAVRIVHTPTGLSVHVTSERSQAQNKEKALDILRAKIFKRMEEERVAKEKGMYISKTTSIEWGNQIRSYVFHPYKMVKDHRTNVETSQVEDVLEGGLDEFLEAEKGL
ncbi:MAG: PCRF domain-containing protein, partial [Patescibacteria group bacterium]